MSEHTFRRLIPNALTMGNLLFGTLALGLIIAGWPLYWAAGCVLLSLICDLFDGRAARAFGSDNAFGAQLDSLSDLVSFGVTPALALYTWKLNELGLLGGLGSAALVVASATRLAKFTVAAAAKAPAEIGETAEVAVQGPARFSGLAVTIPAAIVLGLAAADVPLSAPWVALMAMGLAGLMVSAFPYRSFKDRSVALVVAPAAVLCVLAWVATGSVALGLGLGVAVGAGGYALSAPVVSASRRLAARARR